MPRAATMLAGQAPHEIDDGVEMADDLADGEPERAGEDGEEQRPVGGDPVDGRPDGADDGVESGRGGPLMVSKFLVMASTARPNGPVRMASSSGQFALIQPNTVWAAPTQSVEGGHRGPGDIGGQFLHDLPGGVDDVADRFEMEVEEDDGGDQGGDPDDDQTDRVRQQQGVENAEHDVESGLDRGDQPDDGLVGGDGQLDGFDGRGEGGEGQHDGDDHPGPVAQFRREPGGQLNGRLDPLEEGAQHLEDTAHPLVDAGKYRRRQRFQSDGQLVFEQAHVPAERRSSLWRCS